MGPLERVGLPKTRHFEVGWGDSDPRIGPVRTELSLRVYHGYFPHEIQGNSPAETGKVPEEALVSTKTGSDKFCYFCVGSKYLAVVIISSCLKKVSFILLLLALAATTAFPQQDKPADAAAEEEGAKRAQNRKMEEAARKVPEVTPRKKAEPIEITSDGENRFEGGMAYASGNVEVHYKDDVVYADQIAYDAKSKNIIATGNVRIYTGSQVFRSDQVTFNFETHSVISSHFWTEQERIFVEGESITSDTRLNKYTIKNGNFSTENRSDPGFHTEAETLEIYPDDRVIVKNAVLYMGNIPVLWVPYFYYSLKDKDSTLELQPGSSSRWGGYILASYRWKLTPKLSAALNYDYRSRRGSGGGVDLKYLPKNSQPMIFKSFVTRDYGNHIDVGSEDRPLEPKADRYRFSYLHNNNLTDELNTIANVNVYSDRYVTQDFFTREFDDNNQPDNFIATSYYDPNFTVTALGRGQINNLYTVSERKPELNTEFKRQNFMGTPFSYEGETSLVNFQMRYDRDDFARKNDDYSSVRFDTFHQLLYPRQYFNWLSITPRIGGRVTTWTHNNSLTDTEPEDEVTRLAPNAGLEASFKVSRVVSTVKNDSLGIDGLRHMAEPFINIAYMPTPNIDSGDIRGFDTRLSSTRLQPLNFPAYNSIDSIDGQQVFRHGVVNKLQTKRDGENYDLLKLATYGDLDLDRPASAPVDSPYSELYNDMEFRPVSWLKLNIDSAAGLTEDSFNEVNSYITYQPISALELSLGYDYLDNFPLTFPGTTQRVFDNSDVVNFSTFYRLNEIWRFKQELSFDIDHSVIEDQRYTIFRDMRAWDVSLTLAHRSNAALPDEYYFYFTFTLKAFPQANLSVNY